MKQSLTWKWIAWFGILLDAVFTLKITWMRESSSLMYAKLVTLHAPEVWRYLLSDHSNLIPLRTVGFFLFESGSLSSSFLNLAGNVILFMPLGFLLSLILKRDWTTTASRRSVTMISFSFSLLIEIGQLLMEVGSFDVDDLILNTLGGWLGCTLLIVLYRAANRYSGYVSLKERSA